MLAWGGASLAARLFLLLLLRSLDLLVRGASPVPVSEGRTPPDCEVLLCRLRLLGR